MRVLYKAKLKAGIGSAASAVTTIPAAYVPELDAILNTWHQLQLDWFGDDWAKTPGHKWQWATPFEKLPPATAGWPQSRMNAWIKLALTTQSIVAPDGFSYSYHSLRAGSATAAHSIGVSERAIRAAGNWATGTSAGGQSAVDRYIDALFPPSSAAYELFSWLPGARAPQPLLPKVLIDWHSPTSTA